MDSGKVVIQGDYIEGELVVKEPTLARKLEATLGGCDR